MPDLAQRSLAGGELGPAVYGRADQVKYQTGLRTLRNGFVRRHGGVSNRTGSQFICAAKDSSITNRSLTFVFNADQTYVLLFGHQTMRVVRNGVLLTVSGVAAYNGGTAYVIGDLVASGGVNYYCIAATTGNAPPNATYWYAMPSGGIYEIPAPYSQADLDAVYYVQSGDVVSLDHPSYIPYELRRTGHTAWTFRAAPLTPSQAGPTGLSGSAGGAGAVVHRYKVTAVSSSTLEESTPGFGAGLTITGITQANPGVVTSAGHGYTNGDEIVISGVVGMTQVNGRTFKVAGVTANTFELSGENTSGYTAYSSGGTVARTHATIVSAVPTSTAPNVVAWAVTSGAGEYNIYKEKDGNGVYGYIGSAAGLAFSDTNIEPDMSLTPPLGVGVFVGASNYPSTVGYFDQRRIHANTLNEPEKVFASRSGKFSNFTRSLPLQDDDAVIFTIAGRQVNEVRHLVDIGNLVILTAGGEWVAYGNAEGALTPSTIGLKQVGYNGASPIQPIIVGNNILYIQARGSMVRDFRTVISNDGTTGFAGDDLTVFAPHLFEGYAVSRWAYAQIPNSTIFAVRSDGVLLVLTYIKAHEIYGWAHYDTFGDYEDVVAVPEGQEDAVYVWVRRTIDGQTVRYLERFASRRITDVTVDACFLDSYLTYNGWNTTATTMTLSGGTTWEYTDTLTLTASASFFTAGDVGNAIVLVVEVEEWTAEGGVVTTRTELRCTIVEYYGVTEVAVNADKLVPVAFRDTALLNWGKAVDQVAGLDHLEGETVGILADGAVAANGIDEPYISVVAGTLSTALTRPAVVIHVGLPYVADIETLDMDTAAIDTIAVREKRTPGCTVLVEASRGMWIGTTESNLRESKPKGWTAGGSLPLLTEKLSMNIRQTWNQSGRIFIRQRDPLPLTVLAVYPWLELGG